MAVDIEKVRKSLEVCPIKWVGDGKFTNEILDERHVRVVVPVEGLHLNHVGIVYAGTMFTAMELAAGAIFMCTYGLDEFVPIVSNFEISFLKPTKKDLVAEIEWTEEAAVACRSRSLCVTLTALRLQRAFPPFIYFRSQRT